MTAEVIIAPEAERELNEAINWYDERKPGVGQRLGRDVRAIMRKAAATPERFRLVSRLTRQARVPDWEYSIYFTVRNEPPRIIIVAVFHAKRNPADLSRRLE